MYFLWVDFSKNKKFNKAKNYEILNIKVGQKHYTSYIFTTWYFSHTGWSRFQTDQSTKQNRHLIQNFNAVFNESFQAFFQQSSHCLCPALYLVHTWLRPYQLPTISSLFCHNTYFYWRDFLVVTSRNGRGIPLSVRLLQRMTSYFWCSIDLLMIFFFVSPLYTDPHEHFNSYTLG